MRKQDELLNLIKSLNTSEKRYFKVYSKLVQGNKNYLKLFDLLVKQDNYDATALSKQLGISTKNLADDKQYLQDVLLRALRSFDEQKNGENKLLNDYMYIRALVDRRQYSMVNSLVNKGMARAEEISALSIADLFYGIKSLVIQELDLFDEIEPLAKKVISKGHERLQLAQLKYFNHAFNQALQRSGNYTALKKLAEQEIFTTPVEKIEGFGNKMLWYQNHAVYYRSVEEDMHTALKFAKAGLEYCESQPAQIERLPRYYFSQCLTVSVCHLLLNQLQEGLDIALKLEALTHPQGKWKNHDARRIAHVAAKIQKLTLLGAMNRHQEAAAEGAQLYPMLPTMNGDQRGTMLCLYAVALLHCNKTRQAYTMVEELLGENKQTQVKALIHARMLQLMIHITEKNYALVPSLIASTRTWLGRMDKIDAADKKMFEIFTAIARGKLKKDIARLQSELNKIIKPLHAGGMAGTLGFNYWLKAQKFI